jgi:hypothetical protein
MSQSAASSIQASSSSSFVRHSSAATVMTSSSSSSNAGSGMQVVSSKVAGAGGAVGVQSGSSSTLPQASSSVTATKPESRRGRFEVYPEQALSLSDWTTLPKAPAGFVEASRTQFVKNTVIQSRDRLNRNDRNANYDRERSHDRHDRENDRIFSSSRPRVASSASISSVSTNRHKSMLLSSSQSGASTPQVVAGSPLHSMAPEAVQQYVKQYMLALTALNQMKNSVAGLAQGLGLKGVTNIAEEDSSTGLGVDNSASIHPQGQIASSAPNLQQQAHHSERSQSSSAILSQSSTTTVAAAPPQAPNSSSLGLSSTSSANLSDAERLKAEVERLDRTRRTLLLDKKKLEEDVDEKNKMITILKQKLAKAQLLAK